MIGWSGTRKTLTILAFILPTLLGLLMFNIYPMIYNVYISVTNRGIFHPNPNCNDALNPILEPSCWKFLGRTPSEGLAEPFRILQPFYDNYSLLLGKLFSRDALGALLLILIWLAPLGVAWWLDRRQGSLVTRAVPSSVLWLAGLAVFVGLFNPLKIGAAVNQLVSTGPFIAVMFRTVLYVIACIPLFFAVGFLLALVLNNPYLPGKGFFRVLLILPWGVSTSSAIAALVWQFFFREQGTINQILQAIFTNFKPFAFLNDSAWAFIAVVIVNLWMSYPFFMVVILGALQSIPHEQYEAADVDGASWWDKLTNITLPLVRPAVMPAIVLSSITTFQMFNTVFLITAGGPLVGADKPGATEFVMVYAYKQVYQTQAYGKMGAFAVIIFILLFLATLYSLRVTRITKGAYE
jgi:arabinogalactan oligomer/maltooligosaccharide transport system permease protein